jgi:APA family basic amino acid/polyamine antiporter
VLLSMFSVGALPVLRWRKPAAPRPYRVPLFPLLPAIYLVIGSVVLWASLSSAPWRGGLGLALAALVWGLHRVFAQRPGGARTT